MFVNYLLDSCFFQLFLPIRRLLAVQCKSICCASINLNGLTHKNTNCTIYKQNFSTNFISTLTKIKLLDFFDRFKIMNPLTNSVSIIKS